MTDHSSEASADRLTGTTADRPNGEGLFDVQRDIRNTLRIIALLLFIIGSLLAAIVFRISEVAVTPG